ncbi:MAG TPA: hypothetical protein VN363_08820 [Anaerolineales bacterium]|nr:hypothetical protein [Anaerolineales bacterium]
MVQSLLNPFANIEASPVGMSLSQGPAAYTAELASAAGKKTGIANSSSSTSRLASRRLRAGA